MSNLTTEKSLRDEIAQLKRQLETMSEHARSLESVHSQIGQERRRELIHEWKMLYVLCVERARSPEQRESIERRTVYLNGASEADEHLERLGA